MDSGDLLLLHSDLGRREYKAMILEQACYFCQHTLIRSFMPEDITTFGLNPVLPTMATLHSIISVSRNMMQVPQAIELLMFVHSRIPDPGDDMQRLYIEILVELKMKAVLYEVFSAPDGCAAEEEKADILDRYFDPDFIGQSSSVPDAKECADLADYNLALHTGVYHSIRNILFSESQSREYRQDHFMDLSGSHDDVWTQLTLDLEKYIVEVRKVLPPPQLLKTYLSTTTNSRHQNLKDVEPWRKYSTPRKVRIRQPLVLVERLPIHPGRAPRSSSQESENSEVYTRRKPRPKARHVRTRSSSDSEDEATVRRRGRPRKRAQVISESEESSSSACVITGETPGSHAQWTSDSEQSSSSIEDGGSSSESCAEESELLPAGKGPPSNTAATADAGAEVIIVSESDEYTTGDEARRLGTGDDTLPREDVSRSGDESLDGDRDDQDGRNRIEGDSGGWNGEGGAHEDWSRGGEDWYQRNQDEGEGWKQNEYDNEYWNRDEALGGGAQDWKQNDYDNEYWNRDEALGGGAQDWKQNEYDNEYWNRDEALGGGARDWENWEEPEVVSPSLLATPHQPTPSSCRPDPKELRMTNSTACLRKLFPADITSRVSSTLPATEITTSRVFQTVSSAAAGTSNATVVAHARPQHTGASNDAADPSPLSSLDASLMQVAESQQTEGDSAAVDTIGNPVVMESRPRERVDRNHLLVQHSAYRGDSANHLGRGLLRSGQEQWEVGRHGKYPPPGGHRGYPLKVKQHVGRPGKEPVGPTVQPSAQLGHSSRFTPAEEKRRVGRPRKEPVGHTVQPSAQLGHSSRLTPAEEKRRVGRPRKEPVGPTVQPSAQLGHSSCLTEKRIVGRPRKEPVGPTVQPSAQLGHSSRTPAEEKRRVGRPRKQPTVQPSAQLGHSSRTPAEEKRRVGRQSDSLEGSSDFERSPRFSRKRPRKQPDQQSDNLGNCSHFDPSTRFSHAATVEKRKVGRPRNQPISPPAQDLGFYHPNSRVDGSEVEGRMMEGRPRKHVGQWKARAEQHFANVEGSSRDPHSHVDWEGRRKVVRSRKHPRPSENLPVAPNPHILHSPPEEYLFDPQAQPSTSVGRPSHVMPPSWHIDGMPRDTGTLQAADLRGLRYSPRLNMYGLPEVGRPHDYPQMLPSFTVGNSSHAPTSSEVKRKRGRPQRHPEQPSSASDTPASVHPSSVKRSRPQRHPGQPSSASDTPASLHPSSAKRGRPQRHPGQPSSASASPASVHASVHPSSAKRERPPERHPSDYPVYGWSSAEVKQKVGRHPRQLPAIPSTVLTPIGGMYLGLPTTAPTSDLEVEVETFETPLFEPPPRSSCSELVHEGISTRRSLSATTTKHSDQPPAGAASFVTPASSASRAPYHSVADTASFVTPVTSVRHPLMHSVASDRRPSTQHNVKVAQSLPRLSQHPALSFASPVIPMQQQSHARGVPPWSSEPRFQGGQPLSMVMRNLMSIYGRSVLKRMNEALETVLNYPESQGEHEWPPPTVPRPQSAEAVTEKEEEEVTEEAAAMEYSEDVVSDSTEDTNRDSPVSEPLQELSKLIHSKSNRNT